MSHVGGGAWKATRPKNSNRVRVVVSLIHSSLPRLAVPCSLQLDSPLKSFGKYSFRRTPESLTASPTVARAMADHVLPIPSVGQPSGHAASSKPKLYILDYGAGNVRR